MRIEDFEFGQIDRQPLGRNRAHQSVRLAGSVELVQDGKRFAPKVLAAEQPIAQFVVDRFASLSALGQIGDDVFFHVGGRLAVVGAAVDGRALFGEDGGAGQDFSPQSWVDARARIDDGQEFESELPGELGVARVVGRHGHDRAGAVAGQDVIGHPDWNRPIIDRVGGKRAGEDAGLFFGQFGPIEIAFARPLGNTASRPPIGPQWSSARPRDARERRPCTWRQIACRAAW